MPGLDNAIFPMIREAAQGMPRLGRLGFAGIYWPSLWFPPTPATPPPAAAGSPQAIGVAGAPLSAGTAEVTGAQIAAALQPGFADPEQQKTIIQIGQLVDQGQPGAGQVKHQYRQRRDQVSPR
jgi:hypothetical protein